MNGYPTYLLPDYASAVESGVLDNVDKTAVSCFRWPRASP